MTSSELVTEQIGRDASRGLRWSLFGQLGMKVASFAMGLVLARLLAPADFGTYAIALSATAVLMHINDIGLIAATVQWRGRLEDMAPTATLMSSVFGIVIYGLFFIGSPWFSQAAGDRGATPVVQLLALTIVVDGLTATRSAAIMRNFKQDKLTMANGFGLLGNAVVSIGLALHGAGAYSFAWGQLTGGIITGIFVMVSARLPYRLGFNREIAGKLMRFGLPLAVSLGVESIALNVQFAVVGRLAGAVALGSFLLAYNVSIWAQTILGTAIRYVSVAGFSRLSEADDDALSAGVQRSMPLLVTVVAPIVALTSVLSTPLIALLYGSRWSLAAPVLQVLVLLTLVRMVNNLAMDALMGAGATRANLWVNLWWALVLIPALWWATKEWDITGAAWAQTIVGFLVVVPLSAIALRRVGIPMRPIALAVVRPLSAAAIAGGVAFLVAKVSGTHAFVQLVLAGTAGLIVYVPLAVPREQLHDWYTALRRFRRRSESQPELDPEATAVTVTD
jgi:O-antigen/teichoic acid export membrane protein